MSDSTLVAPPRAKLVGGVWLPETETHLEEWMTTSKRAREVDGKLSYQYHKIEAALRYQRRHSCAIDIGAHVGLWSMHLVKHFDFVHAFEPVPWFQPLFNRNVDMEKCKFLPYALGNRKDRVSVNIPHGSTGASHLAGRVPVNEKFDPSKMQTAHLVTMERLDHFDFLPVNFIKIDVEGHEAEVIRGAEQTIREQRPNIVVECKGNDVAYGEKPEAAVRLLQDWGMKRLQVISGDWIMGW